MKTKHILGLVAVVAVSGFTASAQAGWAVNFSFGLPVPFPPPVVVAAPRCVAPVVYCPPPVAYCPPLVVYAPYRSVAYGAPRRAPYYGYSGYPGTYRGQPGWNHGVRGYNQGGHR